MLNEVHHAEIIDGVKTQRLNIHYNCVGEIDISDMLPIPKAKIIIKTRKGVSVSYSA